MYIENSPSDQQIQYLAEQKHLRVHDFLQKDFAEKIRNCLLNEVNWGLACRIDDEPRTFQGIEDVAYLDYDDKYKLTSQLNRPFQFIYNTYMMVTAYLEKRDPDLLLHRVLEWLNSPDVIKYFRELTGDISVRKINAQATRYIGGHFLTQHNDEHKEEGRLYAYVLGLTKDWNPDWGGLLNILNDKGEIVKTLIPEYNSLSIFKVPQNHFVSYVAPYASGERIGITGWLLDK